VWGLDFGDCHRSLFAHQDTVTSLAFVRDTHYAFSTGKDGLVKYWDLDRWEMLLELPGHHAPVWALGVSAYGDFVVTGEGGGGGVCQVRVRKGGEEPGAGVEWVFAR
jgi:U3 small nucleolar RNA-associated protein 12